MTSYAKFFEDVTGNAPFPYQGRLAEEAWPEVLDVPTGLGKTAAVVVAWLWKRLQDDPGTGRRLVYCLPMRSLVQQTADVASGWCEAAKVRFERSGRSAPAVHVLMGGDVDMTWEAHPDAPRILVGTQDMLLSRALNRGYGMSRFKWPVHFGLLHSDVLWILDETQLMGVAVETSAQLEGLRRSFGAFGPAHTLWMSATLGRDQLATIDHPEPEQGFVSHALSAEDLDHSRVRTRTSASKAISQHSVSLSKDESKYARRLAADVIEQHRERGGLTLVVVNRVARAQAIFAELSKDEDLPVALVHSRFRPPDRREHERRLHAEGDRIVVATQAVEAGIDVSARTLITELAPWPSMVQRFGRCNRYGVDNDDAQIFWIDVAAEPKAEKLALPYTLEDLDVSRSLVVGLSDAGPEALHEIEYQHPSVIRAVLRKRDLVDLFDTSPDLSGHDLDISRYVRDGNDTDVHVYWRELTESPSKLGAEHPSPAAPARDELCAVSVGAFAKFLERLHKRRAKSDGAEKFLFTAWRWNHLDRAFEKVARIRPGQTILLPSNTGGYDSALGWTGELGEVPSTGITSDHTESAVEDDHETVLPGVWVPLDAHLEHVEAEALELAEILDLVQWVEVVAEAGRWHDIGKAHPEFQSLLSAAGPPPGDGPWAKSARRGKPGAGARRGFRHELASALAYLSVPNARDEMSRNLVAYLVAAHHGKVRVSLRSLPNEKAPPDGRAFARGVWEGDTLPAFAFRDGQTVAETRLSLDVGRLGEGSWLSRVLRLRDHPELGPFRLAMLELVVRLADWRASEKEQRRAYDDA